MAGEEHLGKLLKNMSPTLEDQEYVFITTQNLLAEMIKFNPLCSFVEEEGLTCIIEKSIAIEQGFKFDGVFRKITLTVHSSLNAVGLTATVASKLKDNNISANVVAAYYHDHIFVQSNLSEKALKCLKDLTREG
jgi:uncharacterized protein